MEKSPERLEILKKIDEYERAGKFDVDVENDPPSRPLKKGEVDYTKKKAVSKVKTYFANKIAVSHFDGCIDRGELVIKEIKGIENYLAVKDEGVILTCNHFNPFDNYAVNKALMPYLGKKWLWKIIREGNYTGFPGLYGFFFRNCNTLPIPSDIHLMKEMTDAVGELLARGEKILIYPEQAMWWNYRKPRPMKSGAFYFAAKAMAPVLPIFITMEDTDAVAPDGFPIQAYTLHFMPALFPDAGKKPRENAADLMNANAELWKQCYEEAYGVRLEYLSADGGNA